MRKVFSSFATTNMALQRDKLCDSALKVGFTDALRLSPDDYKNSQFAYDNEKVLTQARGAGYWLWKPYLIYKELRNLKQGDLLVYCDAGRESYCSYELTRFPERIAAMAFESEQGFILGPALHQHGPLCKWTKMDCIKIIGEDKLDVMERPTIQATWSFWTPTKASFDFLNEWLKYCSDYRCLTDHPNTLGFNNHKNFIAHRHDQSILTLLAYKNNSSYLDFESTGVFKILKLRQKSGLANQFLRRIDDCESLLEGKVFGSLWKCFIDSKFS